MAKRANAARIELNKTLPWYRKKLGRARGEMLVQAAFAFNSFIVLVFIPISIVYVTDAEWKKKYIPFAYRVNKIEVENYDFPAMIIAKRLEFQEAKRLQVANKGDVSVQPESNQVAEKLRRKADLRKIEYDPEER